MEKCELQKQLLIFFPIFKLQIKPSKYTPASVSTNETKSELESVKQPVAATHVAPVEVSEFEERLDDDVDHKPRHGGYVKTKRTADLHFD